MEVVCTLGQVFILLLVVALFIAGLVTVISSLAGLGSTSTPRGITRRANGEIEGIASEGRAEMDVLSEQYLDELFRQVTDRPPRR